jgi:two-component system, NarL family, invasion response regulator UvrY
MHYVLIADDHEVTRRGVREIVQDHFENVEIQEAVDAPTLIAALPRRPWDVIIIDIIMPGGTVLETLAKIRAFDPKVPVLVLTAATETEYVVQTLKAGANGLINKHRAADELVAAITKVSNGETYLHAETAAEIATSLRTTPPALPHLTLSARELEIFRLIALGSAVKEIALDLAISDKTVATYLARIREKTGLTSHVEIARYALHHGLVD